MVRLFPQLPSRCCVPALEDIHLDVELREDEYQRSIMANCLPQNAQLSVPILQEQEHKSAAVPDACGLDAVKMQIPERRTTPVPARPVFSFQLDATE